MAECLWCGYEMPWPGGSFCSRRCHEAWEAAQESRAKGDHSDGYDGDPECSTDGCHLAEGHPRPHEGPGFHEGAHINGLDGAGTLEP